MGGGFLVPEGFRAIAFWNTGDSSPLERMNADYLLIDPAKLEPPLYDRRSHSERLELVARRADPARHEAREAYRVRRQASILPAPVPRDMSLVSVRLPPAAPRASFYEVLFVVETRDPRFSGTLEIGHRLLSGHLLVNETDEIRHVVHLGVGAQTAGLGASFWSLHSWPMSTR